MPLLLPVRCRRLKQAVCHRDAPSYPCSENSMTSAYDDGTGCLPLAHRTTFARNTGSRKGGAVYITYSTGTAKLMPRSNRFTGLPITIFVRHCLFDGNQAGYMGGALQFNGHSSIATRLFIDFTQFKNNTASSGGAMSVTPLNKAVVYLDVTTNTEFIDNYAAFKVMPPQTAPQPPTFDMARLSY